MCYKTLQTVKTINQDKLLMYEIDFTSLGKHGQMKSESNLKGTEKGTRA